MFGMVTLVRTINAVRLSFLRALLADSGIRSEVFDGNISALEARRPLRYEALRTHGFRDTARRSGAHPCRHVRQAALCYKMFVAALK